jgi:hypothetical protein
MASAFIVDTSIREKSLTLQHRPRFVISEAGVS